MGASERIVLHPVTLPHVVVLVSTSSLICLVSLWGIVDDGPSTNGVMLSITSLIVAGSATLMYRARIVVTTDGVTHWPWFKPRHIPWSEIHKVNEVDKMMSRTLEFQTPTRAVSAARPSEQEYQQIIAMSDGHVPPTGGRR